VKVNRKIVSAVITGVALVILLAALPWAVRDTFENGRIYLFSQQFLDELPQRFSGPGRVRFILQPLIAILLGCRGGVGDARVGRPPYLHGLVNGKGNRRELLRNGLSAIRNLVAMGIVLDAVAQLLIYQELHPGAALVIGPVLICIPYGMARGLSNRVARIVRSDG
jgi:hypothetical protein